MQIIDGKMMAARIKEEIAAEVNEFIARGERPPHLVAVIVGHDGGDRKSVV